MGVSVTIDLPIAELTGRLREFDRRQLPFATALAITRTVQDAQTDLRRALPSAFTIRNNFLEKGIRIKAATKKSLQGRVFTIDEILLRQITGAVKRPRGHAIPLPRGAKSNAKGIIRRGNRPAALRAKRRHFVVETTGGDRVLLRRKTKKRYPIELLWRLHDRAVRIDARFDFDGIAGRSFARNFDRNFGKALARAIATKR